MRMNREAKELMEFLFFPTGKQKKKKKPAPVEKKSPVTEFEDMDDWMLMMILVGVMHMNPGVNPKEAIKIGKGWAKKLHMPRMNYLWKKQTDRVARYGIRAQASKIRRELFKLI